jgi:hypothetical protein
VNKVNIMILIKMRSISREIKFDTQDIKRQALEIQEDTTILKDNMKQILEQIAYLRTQLPEGRVPEEQIAHLRAQLPAGGIPEERGLILSRYLDALTTYADSVVDDISESEAIGQANRRIQGI